MESVETKRARQNLSLAERDIGSADGGIPWSGYWSYLARARHRLGLYREELEARAEQGRRFPKQAAWLPYTEIPALLALGRTEEARRRIEEYLATDPDRWSSLIGWGQEARYHGHDGLARWVFERGVERMEAKPADERDERWRQGIYAFHYELGHYERAREELRSLLVDTPFSDNHIWYLGYLGRIAGRLGDPETARRYDRELTNLDLDRFHEPVVEKAIVMQRIQIAATMGERARAISMLDEAIRNDLPFHSGEHFEIPRTDLLLLRGDPAYDALVRPS